MLSNASREGQLGSQRGSHQRGRRDVPQVSPKDDQQGNPRVTRREDLRHNLPGSLQEVHPSSPLQLLLLPRVSQAAGPQGGRRGSPQASLQVGPVSLHRVDQHFWSRCQVETGWMIKFANSFLSPVLYRPREPLLMPVLSRPWWSAGRRRRHLQQQQQQEEEEEEEEAEAPAFSSLNQ